MKKVRPVELDYSYQDRKLYRSDDEQLSSDSKHEEKKYTCRSRHFGRDYNYRTSAEEDRRERRATQVNINNGESRQ
jgi:hypothetical protein